MDNNCAMVEICTIYVHRCAILLLNVLQHTEQIQDVKSCNASLIKICVTPYHMTFNHLNSHNAKIVNIMHAQAWIPLLEQILSKAILRTF